MGLKRWNCLLVCAWILSLCVCPVFADDTSPEEDPENRRQREILEILLNCETDGTVQEIDAESLRSDAEGRETVTLGEGVVFSRKTDYAELTFTNPSYVKPEYLYAEVRVNTLTQLDPEKDSALTFLLNGERVTSYALDPKQGSEQVYRLRLPKDMLEEGENRFEIGGTLRGNVEAEDGWLSVRGSSFVEMGYQPSEEELNLNSLPYPFVSKKNPTGRGGQVLVSPDWSSEELNAALEVSRYLGSCTTGRDETAIVYETDPEGTTPLAVVMRYDHLEEPYRSMADAHAFLNTENSSTLVVMEEYEGRPVLLITAMEDKALRKGVEELLPDTSAVSYEHTTLGTMNESGLSFFGTDARPAVLPLRIGSGMVLAEGAEADLHIRCSENTDTARSQGTVFWGDVPVDSFTLGENARDGESIHVRFPADVIGTSADELRIRFDLVAADAGSDGSDPWVYVTPESEIHLPMKETSESSLADLPYPFSASVEQTKVVVPDQMDPETLQTMRDVMSGFDGELPEVVRLSEYEETGGNLILIGSAQDHPMAAEQLAENSPGLHEKDAAAVVLSHSDSNPAILTVSGRPGEGMEKLHELLTDPQQKEKMNNQTVIVKEDGSLQCLNSGPMQAPSGHPSSGMSSASSLLPTAACLILLGIILMLVRSGMRKMR